MEIMDELALRKNEINRELNDLTDIRNKAKALEQDSQYGAIEDMQNLKAIEDMLGEDNVCINDIADDIRHQLKQYDAYAQDNASDGLGQLDKRINELEDELESINRDSSPF
jgi:hypothetical protein